MPPSPGGDATARPVLRAHRNRSQMFEFKSNQSNQTREPKAAQYPYPYPVRDCEYHAITRSGKDSQAGEVRLPD